jgi:glycine cleavage system H protein
LPLTGEITAFNEDLEDTPELVNDDPYDQGWIIKMKISDLSQLEALLTHEGYQAVIS